MEAHNEQFQELAAEIFSLLRTFEQEIIAYRSAYQHLFLHAIDMGIAADLFQQGLELSRRNPNVRKTVGAKYKTVQQQFHELSGEPIGPKMQILRELIQAIRSGDPRLYPSGDAPLKDAQ